MKQSRYKLSIFVKNSFFRLIWNESNYSNNYNNNSNNNVNSHYFCIDLQLMFMSGAWSSVYRFFATPHHWITSTWGWLKIHLIYFTLKPAEGILSSINNGVENNQLLKSVNWCRKKSSIVDSLQGPRYTSQLES